MKLHQLRENKSLILNTKEYPSGMQEHTVDSAVVNYRRTFRSGGGNWVLSEIGLDLLEKGDIKEGDYIQWTFDDNTHRGEINFYKDDNDSYYEIDSHSATKDPEASSRRSDQHLSDILDKIAYYNEDSQEDIKYIVEHYPEAITKPINMYRVAEVTVKQLFKGKVKTEDDIVQFIKHFRKGQYISWSTSKKGIDFYRSANMSTATSNNLDRADHRHHLGTKAGQDAFPVLIILEQQSRGVDITTLLDAVANSKDHVHSNAYISRESALRKAHEVLAPIAPTMKILSIQAPYFDENGKSKVVNLDPNEISAVYDIRKQLKSAGHWSPHAGSQTDRWDTSSIPESFKQYLSTSFI